MAPALSAAHVSHPTPSASADGVGCAADPCHRTILVPLDRSHVPDGVIPTAKVFAARFGATAHSISVRARPAEA